MKKAVIFAFMFMAAINVKAQNGTKFISLRGGFVAKTAFSGTISLDINTQYYNQNEIFAEYYQDYNNSKIKSYMGGFVLKPVLFRSGNTALRLRMGAGLGTATTKFAVAPQLGFEIAQSLGKGFDLLLINRNQVIIFGNTPQRWRVGVEAGIRIPIN
uniref:hypothetical protein n=1 Tax=Pedobacter sp. TaxID=1411316 RepID=UPI0015999810|nr:hypothetical protein [Pedobacter sp.]QJS06251.1 hypothetical protein [Pedobacter sp.]